MLRFSVHKTYCDPFVYFTGEGALEAPIFNRLTSWLEHEAPWKLVERDFYEQLEFDLRAVDLPQDLRSLTSTTELTRFKALAETAFGIILSDEIDICAHKLISGQRIRIHNDFLPCGETHRIVLQLSQDWHHAYGGYLMLFRSDNPEDVHKIIPPTFNSIVGFAIGPRSYHAVSTVKGGARLTLVFSFYELRQ